MLKVGLTGGIASGKSLVSHYFAKLGVDVIDADKIAKELFRTNSPHLKSLKDQFGDSIFFTNKELNRKMLGKIVFSNKNQLKWLNDFTHPLINAEMKKQLSQSQSPYVILDIPLLINQQGEIPGHLALLIDRVIVINVDVETQIKRILERDKISKQEALNIINSQSSIQLKLALADDVINNTGSISELRERVIQLHQQYLNEPELNELTK